MNVAIKFSVSLSTWRPWNEVLRRAVVLVTILIIVVVLCREGHSLPESLTFALSAAGLARAALGTGAVPEVDE